MNNISSERGCLFFFLCFIFFCLRSVLYENLLCDSRGKIMTIDEAYYFKHMLLEYTLTALIGELRYLMTACTRKGEKSCHIGLMKVVFIYIGTYLYIKSCTLHLN